MNLLRLTWDSNTRSNNLIPCLLWCWECCGVCLSFSWVSCCCWAWWECSRAYVGRSVFESTETQRHAVTDTTETQTRSNSLLWSCWACCWWAGWAWVKISQETRAWVTVVACVCRGDRRKHCTQTYIVGCGPELKHVVTLTKSIIGDRREQWALHTYITQRFPWSNITRHHTNWT